MLILPPGHGRALRAPRRALNAREKWMIGSVLGLLCAGAVALVISLSTAARSTGHGCVDVSVQAATGGSELYRCGAQARELCASAATAPGHDTVAGQAIIRECRKAALPVG